MKNNLIGCTLWARQTIESDIFFYKPDKWFKIWFYIVSVVNFQDNKLFKRGENLITYNEIKVNTKATHSQIDGFIQWGKEQGMLTTSKTIRGMVVCVLKYNLFQDVCFYKNAIQNDSETKSGRNPDATITEERKEVIIKLEDFLNFLKEQNENGNEIKIKKELLKCLEYMFDLGFSLKVSDIKGTIIWFDDIITRYIGVSQETGLPFYQKFQDLTFEWHTYWKSVKKPVKNHKSSLLNNIKMKMNGFKK